MIKPPFIRLKTYLLGKTTSYRLNAYDDAAIAAAIIRYLKTREIPDDPQPVCQRAASLIRETPDDVLKDQRLAVQAYTQYGLNGYADVMESRAIERIFGLEIAVRDGSYADHESGAIRLFFWMPHAFRKDVSRAVAFARDRAGIELTLPYNDMLSEVIRVQEANIAANHLTHDLLVSGAPTDHPKVNKLREVASTLQVPQIFLSSAAATQIAAGNWDRLTKWLIRQRMR